jgi:predicted ATPase
MSNQCIGMKITHVKVDNFKSLVDFDLPLSKFSCLVGLNGSGKSTILQFFDFLSQQIKGDLSGWLKRRQWNSTDLNSKLTRRQNIDFEISLSHIGDWDRDIKIGWSASFNRQTLRCTSERLAWDGQLLLKVEDGNYHIWSLDSVEKELSSNNKVLDEVIIVYQTRRESVLSGQIPFEYQGSVLSRISEAKLPPKLRVFRDFFSQINALDLLAPELLRQRTRDAENSLGIGGEKLSAFLHELGEEKRITIQKQLTQVYPSFKSIDISSLRSGWKNLSIQEQYDNTMVKSEARHVADGLLRILAVFAQLSKHQSFLLLDEIENGINPELIEFLIDYLVESHPQILITTHSPMVLNYLEDDVAIEGVIYIYKQANGTTKAIRLFDIPSMRKKLEVMGAGEVYEDTMLTQLNQEISEMV